MPPISRIFVTTDAAHAAQTAGFWDSKPGLFACAGGPIDKIELTTAESDTVLWESSGEGPWYVVLAAPEAAPRDG